MAGGTISKNSIKVDVSVSNGDALDKVAKNLANLQKQSGKGIDDPLRDVANGAQKAASSLGKVGEEAQKIKCDGVEDLGDGLDDAIEEGNKLKTSLTKVAGVSFDKLNSGLKNTISLLGKGIVKAAKFAAVGIALGATAVGALTKASVGAYADYEQLVGGVETLFGAGGRSVEDYAKSTGKSVSEITGEYNTLIASQNEVLDNADNAYRTAGLSANAYMETVTGFSASLISSLGGDTKKAAAYADTAIIDMADNANKMGTSMEAIQDAYQGFAKQNYTMLDNLKLGYGGTKTEMERLLKDAEKISGIKYNIDSFADVTQAIHVIQTEMDITGTTAKEAEKTISGSANAMKAAWSNMLVAIVTGGDNFDRCLDNLIGSAKTFGKNIMPAIRGALEGIGVMLRELGPIIAAELPGIVSTLLPELVTAGVEIVKGLVSGIKSNAGAIVEAAKLAIAELIRGLYEILTGQQMDVSTFESLKNSISSIMDVITALGQIAMSVFGWIGNNLSWILPIVLGVVGAFYAYQAVMTIVKTVTTVVTAAQSLMAAIFGTTSTAVAAGTSTVGASAAATVPQILAMAAALLAVGAAILMACVGLALLAQAAINIAGAGWGAIAVMIAMAAAIVGLAVGAAILGPALTAGAVGFIAFGIAALAVGAAFALIGAGALMAAAALSVIAGVVPVITQYGISGAAAIIAFGAALVVFAAGAAIAGTASLIMAAGFLPLVAVFAILTAASALFAASMLVIAVSMTVISATISVFKAALLQLPGLLTKMSLQMMLFAVALLPVSAALLAATAPFTAFAALMTVTAVSMTLLAVTATVFLAALTGISVVMTAINAMILMFGAGLTLVSVQMTLISATSILMLAAVTPLAAIMAVLAVSTLALGVAMIPLTAQFTLLAVTSMLILTAWTAMLAIATAMTVTIMLLSAGMAMLNISMTLAAASSILMLAAFTPLVAILLVMVAPVLALGAALVPLTVQFTLLSALSIVLLASCTALFAVLVGMAAATTILAANFAVMSASMTAMAGAALTLSVSLLPLIGPMLALVIPVGVLAAAMTPLASAFGVFAASAVVALASLTGLQAITLQLVSTMLQLVMIFTLLMPNVLALAQNIPLLMVAMTMLAPVLLTNATAFTALAAALTLSAASAASINGSFTSIDAQIVILNALFIALTAVVVSSMRQMSKTIASESLKMTNDLTRAFKKGDTEAAKFAAAVRQHCSKASSAARACASNIRSAFSGVSLSSVGSNMIQGLISGINSKRSLAVAAARNTANAINAEFRRIQDINSPSGVWESYGEFLISGGVKGMENATPQLTAAANKAAMTAYPFDRYMPETDSRDYSTHGVYETNTYAPNFYLTVSGAGDDRTTERKVKRWVLEALESAEESMRRRQKTAQAF